MKDYLNKVIADKENSIKELREKIKSSEDVNEVRSLGDTLQAVLDELQAAKDQLAELDKQEEEKPADEEAPANNEAASRSFNPLASYNIGGEKMENRETEKNPLATMEYRTAFMNFVQKGAKSDLLKRADAEGTSSDLGVLIPETIVQEIIKGAEKVYGQLYSRVKKTNVKGGVKYPVGSFSASLVWGGTAGTDAEHGVSEKQDVGGVTSYVSFTYNIGEIRIAQSLLQSALSVPVFEEEIVKALVDAYIEAMDKAIMSGTGTNQPEGILTEAAKASNGRITAARIISVSPNEMKDWTTFKKKLYSKIPLSMRAARPEFVMNAGTFESNLECLEDANGQPVAREITNPTNGDLTARFDGREVVFVEADIFKAFDDASTNDYFGMYWVPEKAYAINSNMQFGYKRYFDEDTNQWISKGLVIVDGKILDPKYLYLLKKVANA